MTTARTTYQRPAPVARFAVGPSLVTGLVCSLVGLVSAGSAGLYGALLGLGCVVAFFGFGHIVLETFRTIAPTFYLVIALLTYVLQVVALLGVFALFATRQKWQDTVSTTGLGLTIIACTMVWMAGLVLAARRERILLFETGGDR